ncbi:hypothetical protein ABPG75_013825 [Micractinium tetrahymenae]
MAASEAATAQQRLQLLADALAAEFSEGRASAACAATLARLLPSLQYLSIAVSNPAQGGAIVASSNCAAEGPTTLHLHDPLHSAAGRALALGKPLQVSLLNSGGSAVLPAWTDVQQMAASEPSVSHLLCIPFGRSGSEEGGSGRGALLFGFTADPERDARRKAMLAGLAQCLPAPMARLSADTLAFVNFACGSNAQCTCCCGAEEEEEEASAPGSPCRGDDRGAGGSGGFDFSLALQGTCIQSAPTRTALVPTLLGRPCPAAAGPGGPRSSKALLTAYAERGDALLEQRRLTLVFVSGRAEREYAGWLAWRQMRGDLLFSALLLAALAIVCARPLLLIQRAPIVLALGLGMAAPMVYSRYRTTATAIAWREAFVAVVRLCAVAFINIVCIQTYQAHLSPHRLQQWVCFWRLTGAEGLAVTALGLRTRMRLHLVLQAAALGVALYRLPGMCSVCYPAAGAGACFRSSAAAAALFGYHGAVASGTVCACGYCCAVSAWPRHLTTPPASDPCPPTSADMASPMVSAAQKLQLLADALAAEFSESRASAACAAALARLLPGVRYLSIAVSNPAQGGAIVASSNCAAEGPTTLHLHDPLHSAAGRALALGKPLQVSLLNGGGSAVLPAWTDVQQMAAGEPSVSHLLCIPFGQSGSEEGGSGCTQHLQQGSGHGALLFGFTVDPELDARRKAMLAGLAQCLPAPMARLSADTLAFVNFACGSNAQCTCCCGAEEEEEEASAPGSPCRGDDRGAGGSGGAGPSQALPVPQAGAGGGDADAAGPSSRWWESSEDEKKSKGGAAAAAAAADALPAQAAQRSRGLAGAGASRASPRFSKALVAAAEEQGEGLMAQSPVTLAFRSAMMEGEYGRWIAQYHIKVDLLFSMLLMAALVIVSFIKPYRLVDYTPLSLLLGAGMALPLMLHWLGRSMYASWRERLAVALRLYVVAFINLVSIRSYQAYLPQDRLQQWITFWMLTGAESLAVTALGFPIRLQLHLPLQFAAMGVASWNIPKMCADCYPAAVAGACFKSSAAMAALFGYVLPTAGLRYIEQRSRATFASLLRSAAVHDS